MAEKLKITLVKSPIGAIPKQRATVEALGLNKMHKTVEMPDNGAVRRPLVRATRVRKLVPELQDQALKADRCHYTDVCQSADSQI